MKTQDPEPGNGRATRGLYPRHLHDGAFVGWLILLGIYFLIGLLIGRWTR